MMYLYKIAGEHRSQPFEKVGVTLDIDRRLAEHSRSLSPQFRSWWPMHATQARALERMWKSFIAFHSPKQLPPSVAGHTESWLGWDSYKAATFWDDTLEPLAQEAYLDYNPIHRISNAVKALAGDVLTELFASHTWPDDPDAYNDIIALAEEHWLNSVNAREQMRFEAIKAHPRYIAKTRH